MLNEDADNSQWPLINGGFTGLLIPAVLYLLLEMRLDTSTIWGISQLTSVGIMGIILTQLPVILLGQAFNLPFFSDSGGYLLPGLSPLGYCLQFLICMVIGAIAGWSIGNLLYISKAWHK